jgi:hypothetical protein
LLDSCKIKRMKQLFFFCSLLVAQLLIAQPYTVGTQTITYTDPGRSNRSVGVDFRYPGTNGALANGQFPFVIFAHGFSMDQTPYYPYADSLAKRGYIVGLLTTETGLSPNHSNFAQDLLFVHNKLISEGASNSASIFYQKVVAKGAIGGHSMGGGSTVLSAQYGNPQTCSFTFAAATTNPSSITAAKFMTKPYLSFGGSSDCIAPVSTNQTPMYDSSGSACKFLVNITNGLHCQYGNANTACSFGEGFSGCATSTVTRQQQINKTLSFLVPFLDYYLKGDCAAWTQFEQVYSSNTTDVLRRNCTNTIPTNPAITGTASFCAGSNTVLTASPAGFNYSWSNSTTTQANTVTTAGSYDVTISNGVCAVTATPVAVVQNDPPASTGAINAADTVCSGISNIALSVPASALATTYNWTLPAGWNVTSGAGTTTLVASSGSAGGTISVTAENDCGAAAASVKQVVVTPSNLATAGLISGPDSSCAGASLSFSISALSGADSYVWNLPSGWAITTTPDSNFIQLTAGQQNGVISVSGENGCGQGLPASKTITITTPAVAGAITGADAVCGGQSVAYSVAAGADTYQWTLPNGWTITSAPDSNYIELTAGQAGGALNVTAANQCGAGAASVKNITIQTEPVTPGTVNGADTLCSGQTAAYYVAAGTDGYQWTLPQGWVITTTADSNYVEVTAGQAGGTIAVVAVNQCGQSAQSTLPVAVKAKPVITGQIAGQDTVCQGMGQGMYFTISTNPAGDFDYNWTVPNDWSFTGSSNSSAPIVNVNSSGVISASLVNQCGYSDTLALAVVVIDTPTAQIAVNGNTLQASPAGGAYTYIWYLEGQPVSGATSDTYTPAQSGNYSVLVSNQNFCTSLSAQTNFVFTGIAANSPATFNIYPNPNSGGLLYYRLPQNFAGGLLKIVDVTGKVVDQAIIEAPNATISLAGLSTGLYLFTAQKEGTLLRKNFAIE